MNEESGSGNNYTIQFEKKVRGIREGIKADVNETENKALATALLEELDEIEADTAALLGISELKPTSKATFGGLIVGTVSQFVLSLISPQSFPDLNLPALPMVGLGIGGIVDLNKNLPIHRIREQIENIQSLRLTRFMEKANKLITRQK